MSNSMRSKRFTFVLAIVALIAGLSAGQLLVAAPVDMGGHCRKRCFCAP